MKKTNFMSGAIIATLGIIACKVLGLVYVIPFYAIIGTMGRSLYSYAYSIYSMFVNVSTSGVPLAISKSVSEYDTLGNYEAKERIYKLGKRIMTIFGFICFLLMFIFAEGLARYIMGNATGGNSIKDIAYVIRVVSTALLFVPLLSVARGYVQGSKYIQISSIANIIEQLVRVLVVVLGSYLAIKVFDLGVTNGVAISVFGATVGAIAASIYILLKINKNKSKFKVKNDNSVKISDKELIKKIIVYAVPFIIIAVMKSAYGLVDTFTVVKGLTSVGFDTITAETASSVIVTWGNKFNTIIASICLGVAVSLIPSISSSLVVNDMKSVNDKVNQAFQMIIYLTLPMAIGISFLSRPIWTVFYGIDSLELGSAMLMFTIFTSVSYSMYSILVDANQAMNNTKLTFIILGSCVLLKIVLNTPMIHLFNAIGINGYYAPAFTDIFIQILIFLVVLIYFRKKYHFAYKKTFMNSLKTIVCSLVMLICLIGLKLIINQYLVGGRMISMISLAVYSIVGMIIYFVLSYKIGLVDSIFGKDRIDRYLKKFHLKKS